MLWIWSCPVKTKELFLKNFAKALLKDFADFALYGIVKNLTIYFAEIF